MEGLIREIEEGWPRRLKASALAGIRVRLRGKPGFAGGGSCLGASRPEGQVASNLMHSFGLFGLDDRGAWRLLMDDARWDAWKRQQGFTEE